MMNKLLKITRILFLSGIMVSYVNIYDVWAYWNEEECKEETVDEEKLLKDNYSEEEIAKTKQLKKAEYEFCMARKQIADKDAKDRNLGFFEYSEVGYIEPEHFTADGKGRSHVKLGSVEIFADVNAANEVVNLRKKYPNMTQNLVAKAQAVNALMDGIPCGSNFPFGCPPGEACYSKTTSRSVDETNVGTVTQTEYECKNSHDTYWAWTKQEKGSGDGGSSITVNIAGSYSKITTDSEGNTHIEENFMQTIADAKNDYKYRGDNSECDIAEMQQKYQGSCYSCKIILTLITTFMNACSKVYDISRDAGGKVLVIGAMLWLATFALKLVSSFTNQEPMSILNDFFIFMFKVTAAYLMLNAGVAIIVNMFINPLLMAGADYGLGLLQAANKNIINVATTTSYTYNGTEVISAKVINKLMALTQGIDKTVATNLVIGHALTCHSFNAGMIHLGTSLFGVDVSLRIPDIWIWLCGASIWFCGFMLTLGVGYYLLDVCFKIGFCIIALPIVIGLWPFKMTEGKFKSCMSIILHSAGLFAFLALTVSYALTLISASLGDVSVFYAKIKAGDHEWISNTFSISGKQFILIMFAYVYGIKMIGATVTGYLGKFFGDNVFGSESPMHGKATQMTDFAKKKVTQAASFAGEVVTHQATRAVGAVAGGATRAVKGGVNKAKAALSKDKDKDKDNDGDGSKQKSNE